MKEIYMIFEDVPYREDGNYGVEARTCHNFGFFTDPYAAEDYAKEVNDNPVQNDPDSDDFDPERFYFKPVKLHGQ